MPTTFTDYRITPRVMRELRNAGKLRLPPYQRPPAPAWDKAEKRDALIDSMLQGWSINTMHVSVEWEDGITPPPPGSQLTAAMIKVLWLADGQQRVRVIAALTSEADPYSPTTLTGDFAPLNAPLKDWSDEHQTQILDYPVSIQAHNLDQDDMGILFGRLNRPAVLTDIQASRARHLTVIKDLTPCTTIKEWDAYRHQEGQPATQGLSAASIEMIILQLQAWIAGKREMTQTALIKWLDAKPITTPQMVSDAITKGLKAMNEINAIDPAAAKKAARKVNLTTLLLAATYKHTTAETLAVSLYDIVDPAKNDRPKDVINYFSAAQSATASRINTRDRLRVILSRVHKLEKTPRKLTPKPAAEKPEKPEAKDRNQEKLEADKKYAAEQRAAADAKAAIDAARQKAIDDARAAAHAPASTPQQQPGKPANAFNRHNKAKGK